MSAVDVVGWVAHLDRVGTSTVEEVDGYTIEASGVGGCEASREVGEQVDAFEVSLTRSENTGDGNERSGVGGVVANDGGVDHQCQEGLLVVGSVVLEKCHGVWTDDTGLACVVVVLLIDRWGSSLLILSILCLHLSQSDGGSGSVITCGIAATLSSELKPKMNVFMIDLLLTRF